MVLKAYRDLERESLIEARAGQGTFVRGRPPGPPPGTPRQDPAYLSAVGGNR